MSEHSQAAILSIFAGIVVEHVAALRGALVKLAARRPSDEDLHQFRVTLRRLRSAWVTFAPVLPEAFAAEWKPRLRALAASTGPVREWDVLLLDWLPAAQQSLADGDEAGRAWLTAAITKAKAARSRSWRSLRANLASPDVLNTLADLEMAVLPFRLAVEAGPHAEFARDQARVLRKKLIDRGRSPKQASPARLHRARITAKQWRYLYEAFYLALGAQASKRCPAHLRKLQDALGEVHDAAISLERAAGVVKDVPPASIVSAFHKRARVARKRAARQLRWIREHPAV
ncbi:CHAD domain-containing protein [Ralstonia insidiosa]|uniref:CHAD domain-containing protein n=1 Tax=Ralstonia insidiosa TaxID=190721 RepID=A0A848P4Y1_9RALS|nr:CHAD domain-containing protein [Ralstonia insidiosa]